MKAGVERGHGKPLASDSTYPPESSIRTHVPESTISTLTSLSRTCLSRFLCIGQSCKVFTAKLFCLQAHLVRIKRQNFPEEGGHVIDNIFNVSTGSPFRFRDAVIKIKSSAF